MTAHRKPAPRAATPRVAIVGLDGATWDLIEPWVAEGRLPVFAKLMAEGAYGPLRSTIHPISPQAWSTFQTGMNAGKHGLYDFVSKAPGSYSFALTHGGYRRGRSLWQHLSAAGKRVAVINIPFSYPPEPVNGWMISGFDAPRADPSLAQPPEIYEQVVAGAGGYTLHEMYPVGYRKTDYEAVLLAEIRNRVDVARWCLAREPWDCFMIVVNATDLVQHLYWAEMLDPASPYRDVIRHVYEAADQATGELLELFRSASGGEVDCFVMSDHGAGPIRKTVYLNEWLQQQGWLSFRQEDTALAAQGSRLLSRLINNARRNMKQRLPRGAKDWLKQKIPRLRNRVESWLQTSDIDWARTRAFSGGNFGNIYINVQGREAQGTVAPGEEYAALVAEIRSRLQQARDPETGAPLVERVYHRDELYHGPYADHAPDLIVEWKEYAYYAYPAFGGNAGELFGPPPEEDATEFIHSGTHRLYGILMAHGPGIQPGKIEGAQIADLAPTILHRMGLPVPGEMDGRVLTSLLRDARPVIYTNDDSSGDSGAAPAPPSVYAGATEGEVAERLRALGYLK